MFITYTPLRKIAGGSGEIEEEIQQHDLDYKVNSEDAVSLSGLQQTTLRRLDDFIQVKSVPVNKTDWLKWREFGASVMGGETFTLDAFGTKLLPDEVQNVKLVRNSFKETRDSHIHKSFSFKVRVV